MAVFFNTVKFKGLTNFTGDANYLKYDSSAVNAFQSSVTPYEATYQVNFQNHTDAYARSIATGALTDPSILSNEYAPKYKIYNFYYSINKPVKIEIRNGLSIVSYNTSSLLCLNPNTGFQTNRANTENLLNFSFDCENVKKTDGTAFASGDWYSDLYLVFTPTAGTNGYINYSVKYYDKYLVIPNA